MDILPMVNKQRIILILTFLLSCLLAKPNDSFILLSYSSCCDSAIIKLTTLCQNDSIVEGRHIYENSKESLKFKAFISLVKCSTEQELLQLMAESQNNVVIAYAYMGLKIKSNEIADRTLPTYFKKIKYLEGDLSRTYSESSRFIVYINKNMKRLQDIYLKS